MKRRIVTNLPGVCMAQRYPFLQPAFLDALAASGALADGGWQAHHLVEGDLFLPLWLRHDSSGEFVFDHGWAHGAMRAGIPWYPKLVTAIPFTPVPGPRWRGEPDPERLWQGIGATLAATGAHSWHLLFPDDATRTALAELPLIPRQACHFRWYNRGYRDYDDFLAALTSRKRKSLRRERARAAAHGLDIRWVTGRDIPGDWWPAFWRCYAMTYHERGQRPYLPPAFFTRLAASPLADQLALAAAFRDGVMEAAAFYLFDDDCLYGRYWGCLRDYDALHFELCYHRGIEFCIAQDIARFDPGVQGEHKILRGFEPEITWSLHWIVEPRLRQAIAQFCEEEGRAVRAYRDAAREVLPYRRG